MMRRKSGNARRRSGETESWLETYFIKCTCLQFFWPAIVMKKWLNIKPKEDEFSADERDTESDFEEDVYPDLNSEENDSVPSEFSPHSLSCLKPSMTPSERFMRRLQRGKSETLRVQYIDTKELKILVGTWNVGGRIPPDDLDIAKWLDKEEQADMYVLGFQEVVPLNAGNIFGAEDSSPILKWESIIRRALNSKQPSTSICKSFSAPPSPSRINAAHGSENIADMLLSPEQEVLNNDNVKLLANDLETQSSGQNIEYVDLHSSRVPSRLCKTGLTWPEGDLSLETQRPESFTKLRRFYSSSSKVCDSSLEPLLDTDKIDLSSNPKLKRMYSMEIGLRWPEQPLDLGAPAPFPKTISFKKCHSAKVLPSSIETDNINDNDASVPKSNRLREHYVRIVSKQMVGIYVSIWVHQSLRKHINNIKVAPVGVGVMGYIGNKGAISVSMSIYQTSFCFVCTHLTSGERECDALRRNSDVLEILRRTRFPNVSEVAMPETISTHDRVIWFGDLNYRLNLSHEKTNELVSKREWEELSYCDQLKNQLRRGRVFDGWSEGLIDFAPTYKYELNSNRYFGENSKPGDKRRTPAWCDRILYIGRGIKQMSYKRIENMLSDHRPVNAIFLAEVEIFSRKKLQRALTFTNKELEVEQLESESRALTYTDEELEVEK